MLDPSAFNIVYYVILPNEDLRDQTPFQGFTLGNFGARDYIYRILSLPQNLLELKADKNEALRARAFGITCVNLIPIEERFIRLALAIAPTPFNVLYSFESNHDIVTTFINDYKRPLLHVSEVQKNGAISVNDLRFKTIWNFCQTVKADLASKKETLDDLFNEVIGEKRKWQTDAANVKMKQHMLTKPNEILLKSFYFGMGKGQRLGVTFKQNDYIESVFNIVKEVINIQHKSLGININSAKSGMILTSFGMFKHIYKTGRLDKDGQDLEAKKEIVKVQKTLARQTNYWMDSDSELILTKAFQAIVGIRTIETEIYTMALTIEACNSFSPVLRLPPGINLLGSVIKNLASCSRARPNPNQQIKLNRLFKTVQQNMSKYFYPEYAELVKKAGRNVKIISDVPLEWLPLDGLPLMIRKCTSRITITPGNMMFIQVLNGGRRMLSINDFKKVLVLRSFSEGDVLKNILTNSANIFGNVSSKFKLNIIYRDVKSEGDFIEAINGFDGAILVYDGHGGYDKQSDTSGLFIGDTLTNVWSLKHKIKRVPPIVLLSACDTHPVDSSHVTVANGFISLGATTVLSTLMPVDGKESAIMVGRLIYRIEEYLPIYLGINKTIRWSHLVSGLQKMVYMTALNKFLCLKLKIELTEQNNLDIGIMFNHYINSDDDNWYEKSIEHFAKQTGRGTEQIQDALSNGFFCEALKYVQIGNPENIVIHEKL